MDTHCLSGTSPTVATCIYIPYWGLVRTARTLAQLVPPSCPRELLTVDNASTEGTPQLVMTPDSRTPGMTVRVVREGRLCVANAGNRAIEEEAAEFTVPMENDETSGPHWLNAYERIILAKRPNAAGGRIEVIFEGVARPTSPRDELPRFLGHLATVVPHVVFSPPIRQISRVIPPIGERIPRASGLFSAKLGRNGTANTGGGILKYTVACSSPNEMCGGHLRASFAFALQPVSRIAFVISICRADSAARRGCVNEGPPRELRPPVGRRDSRAPPRARYWNTSTDGALPPCGAKRMPLALSNTFEVIRTGRSTSRETNQLAADAIAELKAQSKRFDSELRFDWVRCKNTRARGV